MNWQCSVRLIQARALDSVIFTGLFVSAIGLSFVSLVPHRMKVYLASLITEEYTSLSPVNWNSQGMFKPKHKKVVDHAQTILGTRKWRGLSNARLGEP